MERSGYGIAILVLLGAVVLIAGVGPLVFALPSGAQNETAAVTQTATQTATPTPTQTATPTPTQTATPTPTQTDAEQADANLSVVIEHWSDRIQVAVLNETLPPAIDSFEVRGATMDQRLQTDESPIAAEGGIEEPEEPTTVRVVAIYDDGSQKVIHEQRFE